MDDLQECLEEIIEECSWALQSQRSLEDLRAKVASIKQNALFCLDLAIDQAVCGPASVDDTGPTLFVEEPRTQ